MTHWRKFTSQRHPDFTLWGSPDFSCESTLWYFITVLCCHCNLGIELLTGKIKVDGRGSTNHLCKAKHTATLVTGEGQKPYPATDPKSRPQEVIPLSWACTACPSSLTFGEPSATGQSLLSADSTAEGKPFPGGRTGDTRPTARSQGSLGKCPDKRQGENPTLQPGPGLGEPGRAARVVPGVVSGHSGGAGAAAAGGAGAALPGAPRPRSGAGARPGGGAGPAGRPLPWGLRGPATRARRAHGNPDPVSRGYFGPLPRGYI